MIENLFSVVLYFSLGYISRKLNLFNENSSKVLIDFILYISFPALVVYNVYHLKIELDVLYVLLTGWLVVLFSVVFSFSIGKLIGLDKNRLAAFTMMSTFGNTSFLGFPYQLAFFGEEGLRYAVVFDQLASFLPVTFLSPFILAYGSGKKSGIDIKKVLTFPPFVALVFSFLMKFSGISVPEFVLSSLNLLGLTVIPLALFSVGVNLRFSNMKKEKVTIFLVLLIKMVLVPTGLVFLLKFLGVEFNTVWKSGIVEIAMPPMVLASILVMGAGLNRDIATGSVAIGIIVSFVTVPFVVFIMNNL